MPKREIVLQQEIDKAKDPSRDANHFSRLQAQCDFLTREVVYLLKKVKGN